MENDKLVRLSDVIGSILSVPQGNWSNARYEKAVASITAVDAVEVCRCADCKHWERHVHDRGDDSRCGFHNRQIGRDGYCAWGQRREDGDGDVNP